MGRERLEAGRVQQDRQQRGELQPFAGASGPRVQAELDPGAYPTRAKVSDEELAQVQFTPRACRGEGSYTSAPHGIDRV